MRRKILLATAIGALLLVGSAPSAFAKLTGPCTATLNGELATGHDSAGTAIKLDYRGSAVVEGTVSGGQAFSVDYKLRLAGYSKSLKKNVQITSDGTRWTGTVSVKDYAWAAIGLYEVDGIAQTSAGVCKGSVYVCVTGKPPIKTAAGATGAGVGALGLFGLARSLLNRKPRAAARRAIGSGSGGLFLGLGGALVLQQSCVLPLTPVMLAVIPGGGAFLSGIIGLAFGIGKPIVLVPPMPVGATGPPDPEKDKQKKQQDTTIFELKASPRACKACRSHATQRMYQNAGAVTRAHWGCHCAMISRKIDEMTYNAYFTSGTVYDKRHFHE